MAELRPGLVSIGMPVFRGERFIAAALDSVLAQTYPDFEVIIADNASDDGTAAICQRYAARDPRIVYRRNATNIGIGHNHSLVFALASGEYFRWLAHDDRLHPDCLRRCVEALAAAPDAGMCYTATRVIDEDGREIVVRPLRLAGAGSPRPSDRLAAILFGDRFAQAIFALFRTELLARTRLLGSFHNSDRVLLTELALMAPILYVAEPLFDNRHYPGRYTSLSRPRDRAIWHQARGLRARCPMWHSYGCYLRNVFHHVPDTAERLRCLGHLLRWWVVGWNAALMGVEAAALVLPGLFDRAQRLKHRWVGDVTSMISMPDR